MKCKTFIAFFIVLISANILSAQTSDLDIKLAKNYYIDGDYEKAVLYFEKIAKDPNKIVSIYDYYKNALIELNQIKSAEKLCKSIIKQSPDNLSLLVDLGGIYGIDENLTKQNQFFDKAIDKINNQTSFTNVSNLGLSFEKIGDLERAIIVYKKGGENNETNPYAYHNKLAIIYNKLGKTSDMVNTYLELLDQSERYLSAVQNGFSNSIDFDIQLKEKEILRKALIKKVQDYPKKVIYLKLLSWFYLINNDYESAFIQIKALDRNIQNATNLYLFLGGLFVAFLVVCNLIANKFVSIQTPFREDPFIISAGVIPYPITFLITDLLSEFYGAKKTARIIFTGFIASILIVFVLFLGGVFPAIEGSPVSNEIYNIVFGNSWRVISASMIAYLLAQYVDVYLYEFWKKLTNGRMLWLRNNGSTIFSQLIDTILVVVVLFFC